VLLISNSGREKRPKVNDRANHISLHSGAIFLKDKWRRCASFLIILGPRVWFEESRRPFLVAGCLSHSSALAVSRLQVEVLEKEVEEMRAQEKYLRMQASDLASQRERSSRLLSVKVGKV
jgi:hypothetical protein